MLSYSPLKTAIYLVKDYKRSEWQKSPKKFSLKFASKVGLSDTNLSCIRDERCMTAILLLRMPLLTAVTPQCLFQRFLEKSIGRKFVRGLSLSFLKSRSAEERMQVTVLKKVGRIQLDAHTKYQNRPKPNPSFYEVLIAGFSWLIYEGIFTWIEAWAKISSAMMRFL